MAGTAGRDDFRLWESGGDWVTEVTLKVVNVAVGARRPAGLRISHAAATSVVGRWWMREDTTNDSCLERKCHLVSGVRGQTYLSIYVCVYNI